MRRNKMTGRSTAVGKVALAVRSVLVGRRLAGRLAVSTWELRGGPVDREVPAAVAPEGRADDSQVVAVARVDRVGAADPAQPARTAARRLEMLAVAAGNSMPISR